MFLTIFLIFLLVKQTLSFFWQIFLDLDIELKTSKIWKNLILGLNISYFFLNRSE